jgi:hypothetical protein
MKPYRGAPMTLGIAAAAKLCLMVWCKVCGHQSEPDPAEQARWYGPETPVPEWRRRLVCSNCGSRCNVDMVVSGTPAALAPRSNAGRKATDLEKEKRMATLRGRRAELHILYRSCPPAHRQRVRDLVEGIEQELRDLGDDPKPRPSDDL